MLKQFYKRFIISGAIALSIGTAVVGQDYGLHPIIPMPEQQQPSLEQATLVEPTLAQPALVQPTLVQPALAHPALVHPQGIIGVQAGLLNGAFITSRLHETQILISSLGFMNSKFALQLQLNSLYTLEGLACYVGASGILTSGHHPQVGIGIPWGLIYQTLNGPTFFIEFGPQIISGPEFEILVQATARVGIPLDFL